MATDCRAFARRALAGAFVMLSALAAGAAAHAQELPSGPISLAGGRVTIGTDVTASLTAQDDEDGAWFNYTDYEHNALRMLRLGVAADVRVTDRISVLAEIRAENSDTIQPYALYVRVRPWRDRPIDIQAGRIPPTFGAFPRRIYGADNPLIGYPLAYQYLTSVRSDALPSNPEDVIRMRARGWRPSYPIGSLDIGTGLPMVSAFRWDTGVQVRIGDDALQFSAALTNGTLSDPRTRDNNGGKQVAGRMQWRANTGLVLGGSVAHGAYIDDSALATASMAADGDHGKNWQTAFGIDAEYSRDHWLLRGEAIWNRWQMPTFSPSLVASGVYLEGRYKVVPGVYVASRVDRLGFSDLASTIATESWDAPVTRLETGGGWYIQRNLLAKLTYQYNWRDGGLVRRRGLLAAQFNFWL